jgi:4-amino-4-deoxy-L-arabinose transferase-like glycosyltransferase
MGEMPPKLPRWLWLAPLVAYALYFQGLSTAGLLSKDEPRYAAISREMARSGDWVTPRLWGQPWFEKSPLLYWMSAVGFRLGWGPEVAPRLPVALLAVAFLAFYWWILRREFGDPAASMATWILATGAAWVGFGYAGVTDLPLAATFSAAMLLALPWIGRGDRRWLPLTALLGGVALLGKYGVAAVLAAPLAVRWRNLPDLLRPRVLCLFVLVAAPWYVMCFERNGMAFAKVAWEHQFGRFTTGALGHTQQWWYYLPVLAGLLLPWTPLVVLVARRSGWGDLRRVFLLAWAAFGLVFFSLSVNKLPGYLLPLCPPLAALMGLGLAEARRARGWLVACALLLVVFPVAVPLIPAALAEGLRRAPRPAFQWPWLLPAAAAIPVWILETRGRRLAATAVVAMGAAAGAVYVKRAALPEADRMASARPLWREIEGRVWQVCTDRLKSDFVYGLGYYAEWPLPECSTDARPIHLVQAPGEPPRVEGPQQ